VNVKSPEDVWWEDLVYRRTTEGGYDLIVHLVRKPPTKEWNIDLADDPDEVRGAKVVATIPSGRVENVTVMRPYYYEDDQQPVHTTLTPNRNAGEAAVELPPFRYHSMVVFRVKDGKQGSDLTGPVAPTK